MRKIIEASCWKIENWKVLTGSDNSSWNLILLGGMYRQRYVPRGCNYQHLDVRDTEGDRGPRLKRGKVISAFRQPEFPSATGLSRSLRESHAIVNGDVHLELEATKLSYRALLSSGMDGKIGCYVDILYKSDTTLRLEIGVAAIDVTRAIG